MHKRIKTLADLKARLEGWTSDEDKLFAEQLKAREENKLAHFMRWYGVSLHIAVVRASIARELLEFIDGTAPSAGNDAAEPLSDEEKLSRISTELTNRVVQLDLRLTSRNGSTSHNMSDDAERETWLLLFQMFNSGY